MKRAGLAALVALVLGVVVTLAARPPASAGGAPEIIVYGATWCGPCQRLKGFLTQNGVRFDWRDVDLDRNREPFEAASGGEGKIPLTLVDGERVRGTDYDSLTRILDRKGIHLAKQQVRPGEPLFGGETAPWWQAQFRDLRRRVADQKKRVDELARVAVDDYERGVVLKRLTDDYRISRAALEQLETDASRAALPRQYRDY